MRVSKIAFGVILSFVVALAESAPAPCQRAFDASWILKSHIQNDKNFYYLAWRLLIYGTNQNAIEDIVEDKISTSSGYAIRCRILNEIRSRNAPGMDPEEYYEQQEIQNLAFVFHWAITNLRLAGDLSPREYTLLQRRILSEKPDRLEMIAQQDRVSITAISQSERLLRRKIYNRGWKALGIILSARKPPTRSIEH